MKGCGGEEQRKREREKKKRIILKKEKILKNKKSVFSGITMYKSYKNKHKATPEKVMKMTFVFLWQKELAIQVLVVSHRITLWISNKKVLIRQISRKCC